ncbi:aminopeptidase P family protein [Rhizobium leguminosarum]|uniref:M24 family metallopeptidase n=1 Tax=Rhizobium leguminosarum TaxID=384 RepID=UPI001C98C116|nr:Xaa-Pro peptidase family protein [Rhizobium leguminosarum]MBY5324283.1 aminopeptidase P family protein [Rhizobium leguminosarum]
MNIVYNDQASGQKKFPSAPDVSAEELASRLSNIRREMDADGLDVIVLTDVVNIQYFTDFRSYSWYFHSRPFFALITATEISVIAATYERAHVDWKPRGFTGLYYDGYVEEGVKFVADTIRHVFKAKSPRIGIDYGEEMAGRSSLTLVDSLRALSAGGDLKSAAPTLWRVRLIKTPFEAALKRNAFTICDNAFDQTLAKAHIGITEYELWGMITAQTFLNGAEGGVPFPLIFSKGDFTFGRPPGERRLEDGHYIWADFRATYGGYTADRNRIARAGEPKAWERETYTAVRDLTLELCAMLRPGITCADFFHEAMKLWVPASVGNKWTAVARFGHSGGMGIVEPPSLGPDDHVEIRPGMILHVEPKLERDGAVFQFEECVFVREDGIEFLTPLCPETIPVIR